MGKHDNRKPLGDHTVGYCRPPRRRKGDRRKTPPGPKGGRSVGLRRLYMDFFGALEEEVEFTHKGRKYWAPAGVVMFRQLAREAAKGEAWALRRATYLQLRLLQMYEDDHRALTEEFLKMDDFQKAQIKAGRKLGPEWDAAYKEFERRARRPGNELFDQDEEDRPQPKLRQRRYGPL